METNINPVDLIDHSLWAPADLTVGQAFHRFTQHAHEYMAVLDEGRLLGLCARQDLGMLLGSQYGFSLFAQQPLSEHLRPALHIVADRDIREAFDVLFSRSAETFYDDVILLSPEGAFLGLITIQTLIKLQNHSHWESIRLLKAKSEEVAMKNEQIEADLRLSRELQQALLPETCPVFPPGSEPSCSVLRFHQAYRTFDIVGGDFFHIQPLSDGSAGVFIADVMGHGVRSALVTAMLRALLEKLGPVSESPGETLTQLNHELVSILNRGNHEVVYATALYMIVNATAKTVAYATAGHPYPIHVRHRDNCIETLQHGEAGTLLGVFDDENYCTAEWRIAAGDSILLFTDGIFEVEDQSGTAFGIPRMLKVIGKHLQSPTSTVLEQLIQTAMGYSKDRQFTDDVCLLAIDIDGS